MKYLNRVLQFLINHKFYFSFVIPSQYGFQIPATIAMDSIVNLHHFIMYVLTLILFFVFSMIFFTIETNTLYFSQINNFLKINKLINVKLAHDSIIEILWIFIPSVLLLLIVLPSFSLLYSMEIFKSCPISVKVVGHQWFWTYECLIKIDFNSSIYNSTFFLSLFNFNSSFYGCYRVCIKFDSYILPIDELNIGQLRLLETTNPLILPVHTPIKFYITSADVLHAWAVPAFGCKIDACPGRINEIQLTIKHIGRFYGQCSELCGVNHGFMPITVCIVSKLDFSIYILTASADFNQYIFEQFCIKNMYPILNFEQLIINSFKECFSSILSNEPNLIK